jgi:hypothetical protein
MADQEWTINYLPAEGGRITGKLALSDEAITFNGLYDSSNTEIVKSIGGALGAFALAGGHGTYLRDTSTDFTLTLPRADVARAELRKKRLMKQAVITMQDGSEFIFDYGLLNPKNLVAAANPS